MLKKIFNIFSTVLLIFLVLVTLLLHGTKLFGIKPYAVLSGSMEPKIHTGSLVYVKSVDPKDVKKGDVITFNLANTTVTHRVFSVDKQKFRFITKGDANKNTDPPISYASLIGKVCFTIPYFGYVGVFLSNTSGKFVFIAAVLILISLTIISELIKRKSA